MRTNNYSNSILSLAKSKAESKSAIIQFTSIYGSVLYRCFTIIANTLRNSRELVFVCFDLTTTLLSANKAQPDKDESKNKSEIKSIFFILLIITLLTSYVNTF